MTITPRSRSPQLSVLLLVLSAAILVACPCVFAQTPPEQTVNVLVDLEELNAVGCTDFMSNPDVYFAVTVHDQTLTTPVHEGFLPYGFWEEVTVEGIPLSLGTVAIIIAARDQDGDAYELCDINPQSGVRRLFLTLDLTTCQISGDASGSCNAPIEVFGDDGVWFKFKISVEFPPGNNRCLHYPIWPQPGDVVTVRADALDDNGNPLNGSVDNVEILLDNESNVVASTQTTPGAQPGQNYLEYSFIVPADADHIDYLCRVTNNGIHFAGPWHVTKVGDPPAGRTTVPVLYTGSLSGAIDLCFIPDRHDYPDGARGDTFKQRVHEVIRDVYYAGSANFQAGGLTFLRNQAKLNFWINLKSGEAHDHMDHTQPEGWDTSSSLCDAGIIVYNQPLIWKNSHAEPDAHICSAGQELGPFFHELGHVSFGLSDEYKVTNYIGYFQADHRPNVYGDYYDCMSDPLVFGGPIDSRFACEKVVDGDGEDWFIVDPSIVRDDMMRGWGDHRAQPAELRRIDYVFARCGRGGC